MSSIHEILEENKTSKEFVGSYFNYLHSVCMNVSEAEIVTFIDLLMAARNRGSTIFFLGNGGSAATASHYANDLGIGTRSWVKPFKALSITDNNAIMTAIGNDYGFEDVFKKQLQVFLKPKDVVVAISASGNSANLIHAVDYANNNDAVTIGLTAFDGGKLKQICKHGIHVPCNKGEYGPAEDVHMIIDHLVHAYISELIKRIEAVSV